MKLTLADFISMNVRSFPDRQALEAPGEQGEVAVKTVAHFPAT